MATKNIQLKDGNGNLLMPKTGADNVTISNSAIPDADANLQEYVEKNIFHPSYTLTFDDVVKVDGNVDAKFYNTRNLNVGSTYNGATMGTTNTCRFPMFYIYKGQRLRVSSANGGTIAAGYLACVVICDLNNTILLRTSQNKNTTHIGNTEVSYVATQTCKVYVSGWQPYGHLIRVRVDNKEDVNINTLLPVGISAASIKTYDLNVTAGYYIKNGSLIANSAYCATGYIPVSNNTLTISNFAYAANFMSLYDSEKTYIGAIQGNDTYPASMTFKFDSNVAYVRFSISYNYDTSIALSDYSATELSQTNIRFQNVIGLGYRIKPDSTFEEHILGKKLTLTSGAKLLALGDSITYGVSSTSDYAVANAGSYKYIEVFANTFGLTLTNSAESSSTLTDHTSASLPWLINKINSLSASLNPDNIIINIGINDYSQKSTIGDVTDVWDDESDNSFFACYYHAIDLLMALYPDAVITLITPFQNYNAYNVNNWLRQFRDAICMVGIIKDCNVVLGDKLISNRDISVCKTQWLNMMLADKLHPTKLGHLTLGRTLAGLFI